MNISYEGKRVSYRLSDTHGRKRAVEGTGRRTDQRIHAESVIFNLER